MPAMPTPAEGVLAIPAALYTPEPPVETLPGGAGLVARRVKATTPAAIKHQAQREQPVAAVQSKRAAGPQWWRMLFHVVGMCTAAILCLVIEDPYWRGGLCIFALVLAVLYELGRKSRNNWFGRLCNRPIVREHEVDTRAASTDFGIAMAVMAMFSNPRWPRLHSLWPPWLTPWRGYGACASAAAAGSGARRPWKGALLASP